MQPKHDNSLWLRGNIFPSLQYPLHLSVAFNIRNSLVLMPSTKCKHFGSDGGQEGEIWPSSRCWFSFLNSFFFLHNILCPRTAETTQHKSELKQLQNNNHPSRKTDLSSPSSVGQCCPLEESVCGVCMRETYCVCAIDTFFSIHWLRQVFCLLDLFFFFFWAKKILWSHLGNDSAASAVRSPKLQASGPRGERHHLWITDISAESQKRLNSSISQDRLEKTQRRSSTMNRETDVDSCVSTMKIPPQRRSSGAAAAMPSPEPELCKKKRKTRRARASRGFSKSTSTPVQHLSIHEKAPTLTWTSLSTAPAEVKTELTLFFFPFILYQTNVAQLSLHED